MKITKTQKFMLYSLGKWFEEANKKISSHLEMSVSKSIFIDAVKKSGIAEKQPRALYKNLEILEKKKLIKYPNKELKLTPRGNKIYIQINNDLEPYITLNIKIKEQDPTRYTKKIQTVFK